MATFSSNMLTHQAEINFVAAKGRRRLAFHAVQARRILGVGIRLGIKFFER